MTDPMDCVAVINPKEVPVGLPKNVLKEPVDWMPLMREPARQDYQQVSLCFLD